MLKTEWREDEVSAVAVAEPDQAALLAWDRLVASAPDSDVTQLPAWSRVRRLAGYEPFYVFVYRQADLVAGAQILCRRIPVLGRVGYIAYGPLVGVEGSEREYVLAVLGRALVDLGKRHLKMLFVQPAEGAGDVSQALLRLGFRSSTACVAPYGSVRVDLDESEEVLRKNLRNQRLRRLAKGQRWEEKGLRVRIGDVRDVPAFAELAACTAARQGFSPWSAEYLDTLYRELAPDRVALVIGEIDGVAVACHLYTMCGDTVRFRVTGFDRERDVARVGSPGVVHWEALRWSKAQGYRWFDFGGLGEESLRVALDPDGDLDSMPTHDRYKLTFGGTPYRYPPAVELISSPWLRFAYDRARHWTGGRRLIATAGRLLRGGR